MPERTPFVTKQVQIPPRSPALRRSLSTLVAPYNQLSASTQNVDDHLGLESKLENNHLSFMPVSLSLVADELLMALEAFDARISPQGLYAAEEHALSPSRQKWRLEWDQCLAPCLGSMENVFPATGHLSHNWRMQERHGTAMARFQMLENGFITLDMIRLSKIKVRVYGDSHRIDPHLDFSARWEACKMASHFKRHQPTTAEQSMLLLVGFDGHKDPFRKEFRQLRENRNWEHFGWTLHIRSWPDPHHRGFHTVAAIWIPTPVHINKP